MSTGKKRKREEGNEETDGQVPDEFCCSITHQVMVDPVCTKDGHSYERKSITKWFSERQPPTSPKTGLVLTSTELMPNHNLRQAIQNWREAEQKPKEAKKERKRRDTAITRVHLSAGGDGSSSAGGCAPSWEDIRTQLSQLGYPPLACLGCTPMSGGLHCYYGTVSQLLCSVCQHWAGSGFIECDPTATREMLLERVCHSV